MKRGEARAALKRIAEKRPGISVREAARLAGCHERTAWNVLGGKKAARPALRAVVLCDLHLPYHDVRALEIAEERAKAVRPDLLVLNGDAVDFYQVSRFSKDHRRAAFVDELEQARKRLARTVRRVGAARTVYVVGNHEQRMAAYLCRYARDLSALGELSLSSLLWLDRHGVELVDNTDALNSGRPALRVGDVTVLHGHEARVTTGAVNLPRLYYQRARVPVIVGHHHQTQSHRAVRLDGGTDRSYAVGCLANLRAEFQPINDWAHGYAVIDVDADGHSVVSNYEIDAQRGRVLPSP